MENTHHRTTYSLIFATVSTLSLIAFVFCIVAEFKKSKVEDVKLDGRLCELPGSEAYGFGIAALICFSISQIIGSLIIFLEFWHGSSGQKPTCCQAKRPTVASTLFMFSWLSFGMAILLVSTATSMNRRQPYGEGWVNGECYVVKDGIFIGAAFLVLLSFGCTLASAASTMRKKLQISTDDKAQKGVCSSEIK